VAETQTPIDPKHKRLADFYLSHLNAARAGREAGFSPAAAKVTACRILSRPEVQDYLTAQTKQLEKINRAQAFRIYEELRVVAQSDIKDYVISANGNVTLAKGVPKEAWRAVQSIEVKTVGKVKKVKIRLWPKDAALRMQGQAIAMFKDVLETRDRTLEDALDELEDADGPTS
jgi:phage terminase small subunit